MTPSRDEVLRMAREAGVSTNTRSIWPPTFKHSFDFTEAQLERFATLVAAKERETCAQIAEEWLGPAKDRELHIAAAIRARSTKP